MKFYLLRTKKKIDDEVHTKQFSNLKYVKHQIRYIKYDNKHCAHHYYGASPDRCYCQTYQVYLINEKELTNV